MDTFIRQAGPTTYVAQLWRLHWEETRALLYPRKHLISDLTSELRQHYLPNTAFILTGDYNEAIGRDPSLMASVCAAFQLVEAVEHRHADAAFVPTYIRGRTRLDYILTSPSILRSLRYSGLNRFQEVSQSDHRAVFTELDQASLLHPSAPPSSPDLRHIHSDSAAVVPLIRMMSLNP